MFVGAKEVGHIVSWVINMRVSQTAVQQSWQLSDNGIPFAPGQKGLPKAPTNQKSMVSLLVEAQLDTCVYNVASENQLMNPDDESTVTKSRTIQEQRFWAIH